MSKVSSFCRQGLAGLGSVAGLLVLSKSQLCCLVAQQCCEKNNRHAAVSLAQSGMLLLLMSQLGSWLCRPGDRVATLCWNTRRHLESWYGIMGIGAVCHTLNPRLFAEDLEYIIHHAQASLNYWWLALST